MSMMIRQRTKRPLGATSMWFALFPLIANLIIHRREHDNKVIDEREKAWSGGKRKIVNHLQKPDTRNNTPL